MVTQKTTLFLGLVSVMCDSVLWRTVDVWLSDILNATVAVATPSHL